jgi:predicted nucleic acid-binding protein
VETANRLSQHASPAGILRKRDPKDCIAFIQKSSEGCSEHVSHLSIETSSQEISAAFHIEDEARIGFWDALMVAAAVKAGADRILTEDLNAGRTISGLLIENPFIGKSKRKI